MISPNLNFQLYKKLLAGFLLTALVVPTSLTLAQPFDEATDSSPADEWQQEAVRNNQDAERALKQERAQAAKDQSECIPQKPGAGLATSFANVISRGIQQTLSQTINRVISQNLNNIIQRQIGQVLPQVIEQGLRQQLPGAMRQRFRGMSSSEINQQGPNIMRQEVRRLLPQIIQNDFPSALQTGVSSGLTQQLAGTFQSQIASSSDPTNPNPVFLNDPVFQSLLQFSFGPGSELFSMFGPDKIIGIVTQLITEQVQSGTVDPKGTLQALGQTLIQQLQTVIPLMLSNLAANIQSGLANDAGHGVAKSDGVKMLVDRMMPVIMQILLKGDPRTSGSGLMGQFSGERFDSAINSGSGSFDNFNFNDFAGNNITAAIGFDLSPISYAIAQPLALATVSGLGVSGYDAAIGNLALAGFQGTPTIADLRFAGSLTPDGANYLGALSNVYRGPYNSDVATALNSGNINEAIPGGIGVIASDYQLPTSNDLLDPSAFYAANPDFVGPVTAEQIIGADAAANVNPGNIGTNIGNDLSMSGIGGQIGSTLASSMTNVVSGSVGSLVDGIPYVGGLLSPIAEQVVQTALTSLIGPIAGPGTFLVDDPGTHSTVANATKNQTKVLVKPLIKAQGLQEQQVKQNQTQIKQLEEERKRIELQCAVNKKSKNAFEAIDQKMRVADPAARERALIEIKKNADKSRELSQNAATDRFAGPNGEGKSTTANPEKDQKEAAQEKFLGLSYQFSQGTDSEEQTIGKTLAKLALFGKSPAPTMSLTERESFRSAINVPTEQYYEQKLAYWGKNDPMSLKLDAFLYADELANKAQEAEKDKFLAYGRKSNEQCRGEWVNIAGKQVCIGGFETVTPGDIYKARDQAFSSADVTAGINSHTYKEDESLVPFTSSIQQWVYKPNANGVYGVDFDNLPTIENIFNDSFNNVVGNGINNLFSRADMSISQFTSNLAYNFNGNFSRSQLGDGESNFQLQSAVRRSLESTPGYSNLQPSEVEQIIQAIVRIIIARIFGQN